MEIVLTRLLDGRPVLEARTDSDWESRVVLNPAADRIGAADLETLMPQWGLSDGQRKSFKEAEGAVAVVYRAQGSPRPDHDVAPSSLGLALFTPHFELVKRWSRPVVRPEGDAQNLGAEDPRMTRVEDTWHLYYTGYSGDPRTGHWDDRRIRICHAASRDLVNWEETGPVEGSLNDVPNKNAVLLPRPVDGSFVLLHRPMQGKDAMAIHYATSDDPAGPWTDRGVLMRGLDRPECSKAWIGGGGPPLPIGEREFLMIYHRGSFDHDGRREYDLGAAIVRFNRRADRADVTHRVEPILSPTGTLEQVGDPEVGVDNVLFTCANYLHEGKIFIPYAGADSRIFVAAARLDRVLDRLRISGPTGSPRK